VTVMKEISGYSICASEGVMTHEQNRVPGLGRTRVFHLDANQDGNVKGGVEWTLLLCCYWRT
jgi:hypothetical protein